MANNVEPDRSALSGGSALFACAILSETSMYKILGHLLYICSRMVVDY